MVFLSMCWTEFSWNAATCLNELYWGRGLSVPGWSRSVQWPGLPQMSSLSESPQPPFVCVGIIDIFAIGHFSCLFLNSLGPAYANIAKNRAHCFLFNCCSLSLFLPDSHNRMHCIVLIKGLASLLWRNYKCEWETSCCQACTMLCARSNIWRVTSDNFFPKHHGVRIKWEGLPLPWGCCHRLGNEFSCPSPLLW